MKPGVPNLPPQPAWRVRASLWPAHRVRGPGRLAFSWGGYLWITSILQSPLLGEGVRGQTWWSFCPQSLMTKIAQSGSKLKLSF